MLPAVSIEFHHPLPDLPDHLSGRVGTNRASGGLLEAQDDKSAILAWIGRVADSENTQQSYVREAVRLLVWSNVALGKPLSSLTHEDLLLYQRFLENPAPAEVWISKRRVPRQHPDWKPFAGPLSASSRRQAMVILNAMFAWMVEAKYLSANPLSLVRRRRSGGKPRLKRFLSIESWETIKAHLDRLPEETPHDRLKKARSRAMFVLLYLTGIRISEAISLTPKQIYFKHTRVNGLSQRLAWIEVTGKGKKVRQVPLTEQLLEEINRYRLVMALQPLPAPDDDAPLLQPLHGGEKRTLTRQAAHLVLTQICQNAARELRDQGRIHDAAELEAASAHWLRHTAGSRMADAGIDIRVIQENLGHASLDTTTIYTHVDDDRRHIETERHRV